MDGFCDQLEEDAGMCGFIKQKRDQDRNPAPFLIQYPMKNQSYRHAR